MSLWQGCKCKICSKEWSYDVKYGKKTKDNDICEKCEVIIEDEKREEYFNQRKCEKQSENYNLNKYDATVVMINELERLFKDKYSSNSTYDIYTSSVINMVFSTINNGIKQIDEKY